MQTLIENNKPIDLLTLSETMEQQGIIDKIGGFAYLAELSKNTPSVANIVAYAEYIASYGKKRELLALGHDLARQASNVKTNTEDLIEETEQRLFNIRNNQEECDKDLHSSLASFITELELRGLNNQKITGTDTGFSQLNEKTCGLQTGDLILLAARPSMGKTALGLALCESALAKQTNRVQIYSMEMSDEQLLTRFISMLGRVDMQHLRTGQLSDEDWGRISNAMSRLLNWQGRLAIDDSTYLTPLTLRSKVRRNARKQGNPSLIMVDYLQLMRCPGQENRTHEIAEISRSLKALAKEMNCSVLALSQLNRSLEQRADKRPNNGDLRDSGALEQDADLIMFIYRDEVYDSNSPDKGIAEIILGKQRNGPIGTIKVSFKGHITRFEEITGGVYDR